MTDTPTGPPSGVTANVLAELARKGLSEQDGRQITGLGRTAWRRRIERPDTWEAGELQRLATHLRIPTAVLLDGPR